MSSSLSNSLANKLGTSKPRETSGSRSANRFDYQKDWAICELLRLHLSDHDYLLILDYHEDVVVLDSESTPTKAAFYQIKTKKSGNWSVAQLCKIESKKETDSILKKLYSNYLLCPDETTNLTFVSNQGVKGKLKDDSEGLSKDYISFTLFKDQDKKRIHESLEGNDAQSCNIHGLNLISTERTDLSVGNHDVFTKGKLVDFFSTLAPKKLVAIDIAYKTLFDEVKRKNNFEITCSSFDELKETKGIGRKEFNQMVSTFLSYTSNSEYWNQANSILLSEGYNFSSIRKIKSAWSKYTVEIMNTFDDDLNQVRAKILSEIQSYEKENHDFSIKQLIQEVKPHINFSKVTTLDNEPYMEEASIIYEVIVNESIQEANPKSKEEAV